jgi:fatty acid/phospholipid biosynthesis enzyme
VAIICHGSSSPKAVRNAIAVAHNLASLDLAGKLEASINSRRDFLRIV